MITSVFEDFTDYKIFRLSLCLSSWNLMVESYLLFSDRDLQQSSSELYKLLTKLEPIDARYEHNEFNIIVSLDIVFSLITSLTCLTFSLV